MDNSTSKGKYLIPILSITLTLQVLYLKIQDRVSTATGVSVRTLKRIVTESRKIDSGETSTFKTTLYENRVQKKTKIDLDDTDVDILRRIIQNFYITEKKVPTAKGILAKFSADTGYGGCPESLRKILHGIGYRWRKTKTNRKLLMEKNDIANLRCTFLRNVKQYREAKRPIIYMDETYIHSSHTNAKNWDDNTNTGLQKPVSKGDRIIIVHAGSENGFVPGAYARWRSSCTTGDYHREMNFKNYKKWITDQLLPNLPDNSVLVIDNAPYHNKQVNKCPTSTTRKMEMADWLRRRNINFCPQMTKPELYNIIKQNKPRYKEYELDKLLNDRNHDVLRLPPYHPDLNPIELVWTSMKQYVAAKNVTFKRDDVEVLCDRFFSTFGEEEWKKRCDHAIKVEDAFIAQQPRFDDVMESLIINLGEDSETEESSESDDDSDKA
nr:uncharacterized protein LOC111423981 [Onthophagus taurus]